MGQSLRSSFDGTPDHFRTTAHGTVGGAFAAPADVRLVIRRFLHALRARLRCYRRTRGLHQLDIATGRCAYCKRKWTRL